MRSKVIAGNWKMNKDIDETIRFISELQKKTISSTVTVILCPPYTSLYVVRQNISGTSLKLSAQDVSVHDDGAYTGEISATMLQSVGCTYCIIGHSERRQYHQETNHHVNQKAKKLFSVGITPIICVGETLQERENNLTEKIITTQITEVLAGFSEKEIQHSIIAYEPVWAIGTGKTATPQQAEEVHKLIRTLLAKQFSQKIAEKIVIQYGGSVKPENAKDLLSQSNIDGALVGGACLDVDSFVKIISSC